MTLITDAQSLVALSQQAGSAADQSTTEASLDRVFEKLSNAHAEINHGVASSPWWEQLDESDRASVLKAAKRASESVRPLLDGDDGVLASFGRNDDAAARGTLAEVTIAFAELSDSVQEAQNSLVRRWSESLWPADRFAELEVHTFVPESRGRAKAVLDVSRRLEQTISRRTVLSSDDLLQFDNDRQAAMLQVEPLLEIPAPVEVLELFRATTQDSDVPLNLLTPDALAWLMDHRASELFIIRRTES